MICTLDVVPDKTKRIKLKKISEAEIDNFHEYSLQKEIYTHLEFDPFVKKSETLTYLKKLLERIKTKKADYRFLKFHESEEIVGLFGFHSFDEYRKSIEFGYGISPRHQKNGIFKEVTKHMINSLFMHTEIHRIYAYTSINNIPSMRGMLSAGFIKEGEIRDYYLKDGVYFNAYLASRIKS